MAIKTYLRDVRDDVYSTFSVFTFVAISTLLTIAGPIGTFSVLTLGERCLYWSGATLVALTVSSLVRNALRIHPLDLKDLRGNAVTSTLFATIYTPIFWLWTRFFTGGHTFETSFLFLFLLAFVVSVITVQLNFFWGSVPSSRRPKLLERLAVKNEAEIKRLSGRDHYVEVLTESGIETLLMRFSDAVAEVESIPGVQIHRSHWVAENAVQSVEFGKERAYVILDNGDRIPVSRGRRADVEDRFGSHAASE